MRNWWRSWGEAQPVLKRLASFPSLATRRQNCSGSKKRSRKNFARIRHILLPHDYLNFWLTGNLTAEYGDASGTAFFDVRSRDWSTEVLDLIDGGTRHLRKALPRLLHSEDIVGTIRPEVASELGISPDCLVSSGERQYDERHRNRERQGRGRYALAWAPPLPSIPFASNPVLDETGSVAPFCSSSGGWLPLVCTMNATNVVNQDSSRRWQDGERS